MDDQPFMILYYGIRNSRSGFFKVQNCMNMLLILTLMQITTILSTEVDLPKPRLVVIGATGVGKSTISNFLLGCTEDCLSEKFKTCYGGASCTKEASYGIGNWMGTGQNFTVVDTPGFGDSDGQEAELIDSMVKFLKNEVKETNIFLLLFNGANQRVHSGLHRTLRDLELMFGHKFWSHVMLGFTFWRFDQRSVEDRIRNNETEQHKLKDMQNILKERFRLKRDLPGVFFDPKARMDEVTEKLLVEKYTTQLWNFMLTKEDFEFKSIQDILIELDTCQTKSAEDVKKLGVITNELLSCQNELSAMNSNYSSLSDTNEDCQNQLIDVNSQLNNITVLNNKISDLKKTQGTGELVCPSGWIDEKGIGCFHFGRTDMTWKNARNYCKSKNANADLAEIHNAETNTYLSDIALQNAFSYSSPTFGYWMGGSDVEEEGTWIWQGSGLSFGYTKWYNGGPNNGDGDRHYTQFWAGGNGTWFDRSKNDNYPPICQIF